MQFPSSLETIKLIICKIMIRDKKGDFEHGSGVIVKNNDQNLIYVLTAKHCIIGKNFNYSLDDIDITLYIKSESEIIETIVLDDHDTILMEDDNFYDRAIVVLNSDKYNVFENLKSVELLNCESSPLDCFLRGYPAPYNIGNNTHSITVGMSKYIENNVISTQTKLETIVYDEALYNVSGFSGGGVFVVYNGRAHLVSIIYEFQELFQRFKVYSLASYSKLLEENSLSSLTFNDYASHKEISMIKLKEANDRSKAGWLKDRYIPDLHAVGKIQEISKNISQGNNVKYNAITSLINMREMLTKVMSEVDYATKDIRLESLKDELISYFSFLKRLQGDISNLISNIRDNSKDLNHIVFYDHVEMNKLYYKVKSIEKENFQFMNIRILRESLDKYNEADIEKKITKFIRVYNTSHLIFLGDPGTGKTHALANIVDNQISNNLPALLIQAKEHSGTLSWKDIIIDTLGLSSEFSEEEIWIALENTAMQSDMTIEDAVDIKGKKIVTEAKVMICIDGIDESRYIDIWKNRIRELSEICKKHKRLRFIISSRPYPFKNSDKDNAVVVPTDGDAKIQNIFDNYIDFYNVKFESANIRNRAKWSIRTPLALKLFCEIYSDKTLSNNEKVKVTIISLLMEKIGKIDTEINEKLEKRWTKYDHIIKHILLILVTIYIRESKDRIEKTELIVELKKNGKLREFDEITIIKTLEFMADYGILDFIIEQDQSDLFSDPLIYFEIPIQPLIDFMIALKLKDMTQIGTANFPELLDGRVGSQQLYSLMLLEEERVLVGTDNVWNDHPDLDELLKLQIFAISNVSIDIAGEYVDFFEVLIRENTAKLRIVVLNLISIVSRIPRHPLGAEFLHKFLMSYPTPAERDIIWSVPEIMEYKNNALWEGNNPCITSIDSLSLNKEDCYDSLPLIFAWHLTSLDNGVRSKIRNDLTEWGVENPLEFVKLVNKMYIANDPQLKEDMMLSLLGVFSSMRIKEDELIKISKWLLDYIFHLDKIQVNKSVLTRFAGRVILEKAYKQGLIESDAIQLARPPYSISKFVDIVLNETVIEKCKVSFPPITGDLEWYVIKNAYNDFFKIDRESREEQSQEQIELMKYFNNLKNNSQNKLDLNYIDVNTDEVKKREVVKFSESNDVKSVKKVVFPNYSREVNEFLERHLLDNNTESITPHIFTLAAAVKYIENMGWSNEKFSNYSKEDNIEYYGIDIAIVSQYHSATHGSMSQVMTVGEKYTWCAVNFLKGYFADRLPFYGYDDYGERKYTLDDYTVLVDVSNTFIGMHEFNDKNSRAQNYPYLPNNLTPKNECLVDDNPNNIKKWIDETEYPSFEKWLKTEKDGFTIVSKEFKGSWTSLYNYTVLTESITQTDSILWINSYVMRSEDYMYLQNQIECNSEELTQYFIKSHDNEFSSPNVSTYIDPTTLNLVDWVEDLYSEITIESNYYGEPVKYEVSKTVSKVTYKNNQDEESWCVVPSKIIRDILKVKETDGFFYRNLDEDILAIRSNTGEAFRNHQNLLYVQSEELEKVLKDNGLRQFWVVKVLREPSLKARDKYKDFFYDRYCSWIITDDFSNSKKFYDGCKSF